VTQWLNYLRNQTITPVVNVHYKEVDKRLYKNVAAESYTVNDVEAGWKARDALAYRTDRNAASQLHLHAWLNHSTKVGTNQSYCLN
jgi:hypothetical protein